MLEISGYILSTHTHADWVVTTPDGKDTTFKRDEGVCTGMPYINLCDHKEGLVMIETVQKSMGGNTPEHIKGDQLARAAQGRVGHPPGGVIKQMISDNIPENMPIGLDNIADALAIYGPPVSRLKGANTREKTHTRVGEGGKLEIPRDFYRLKKFVTLTTDVMFVSGIPFPGTFSRKIKMITAEYVPSRTAQQIANPLTKIVNTYVPRGFVIDLTLMDI